VSITTIAIPVRLSLYPILAGLVSQSEVENKNIVMW